MLYTCQTNYPFYVKPVNKKLEDAEITTWKYDYDQSYFNFEIQFKLEDHQDFHWEEKALFLGDYRDQIQTIYEVMIKDGLLIIGGLKEKGNEETK